METRPGTQRRTHIAVSLRNYISKRTVGEVGFYYVTTVVGRECRGCGFGVMIVSIWLFKDFYLLLLIIAVRLDNGEPE
jgi:hypothetical protein